MQNIAKQQHENAQSIDHTGVETRARGLAKIARWHRHLFDAEAQMDGLHEHFLVEDKIIGIEEKRHFLQDAPAESAIARMVLEELLPQDPILHRGQKTITEKFPPRHTLS